MKTKIHPNKVVVKITYNEMVRKCAISVLVTTQALHRKLHETNPQGNHTSSLLNDSRCQLSPNEITDCMRESQVNLLKSMFPTKFKRSDFERVMLDVLIEAH